MRNGKNQTLDSLLAQLSEANKHGNRKRFEQLLDEIKRLYPKNCTWPVPKNKLGIVCGHNIANNPTFIDDFRKILKVFKAIEPILQAEIAKTAGFKRVVTRFDPVRIMLECANPLPERTKIFVR
jgi:hypothetical protein